MKCVCVGGGGGGGRGGVGGGFNELAVAQPSPLVQYLIYDGKTSAEVFAEKY